MSPRALSIVVTVALAPVQFSLVAWYILYWDLFPKYSLRRIAAWVLLIVTGVAVPLLQIELYKRLNSVEKIDDLFIGILIFAESAISVALMFFVLIKRRSR